MGFEQVLSQYEHAIASQVKRCIRQKRDFYTKEEQAAIKFYMAAVQWLEPAREGTKISTGDLHAENPDMRRQSVDKLPADSGDPSGGAQA